MNIQDWLQIYKERIIKLMELEDVQSKLDPCEQPYKSQYAARDILQGCISDLDSWMKQDDNRCDYITYLVYFNLSYRLANNFISTEERYAGEEIIFSLCNKIEDLFHLKLFVQIIDKRSLDIGSPINVYSTLKSELGQSINDESQLWVNWLAGVMLRIYNACGLMWAGKIINSPNDPGSENSTKYLGRAKRIYKIYKQQTNHPTTTPLEPHTEICMNYKPPHCFDELMLESFQYETAYLKNECYLMEGIDKFEALKFDLFESDYTTTLFLLAQTFGKMGSNTVFKHKSAKYCYWTLHRQLNSFKYDPVEWSLNAATLSQYYVIEGEFKRARHCIAAAQTILKEAINRPTPGPKEESKKSIICEETKSEIKGNELLGNVDTQEIGNHEQSNIDGDCTQVVSQESSNKAIEKLDGDEKINDIIVGLGDKCHLADTVESECELPQESSNIPNVTVTTRMSRRLLPDPMSESRLWDDDVYEEKRVQGEADIDRCWVSYGLNLLELSFDRSLPDLVKDKEKFIIESKLPDFNLELAVIEREVTDEWVSTYESARQLFLFVQRKIGSARQYYTLDFRCSDAIELICDHSKAFKAISNFEISTERKCIMHKKRIDMLSDLLKTLNQRYYQIPCRKMMLEIGEIYSAMINLKLSLLETTSGPNDSIRLPENAKGVVQKIRLLGKKGLAVYEKFLESYRTTSGHMPDVYAEEDVRPVLIAHFYMARMYSKILEPESSARLKNLVKSLEHYEFIVNYCAKHPDVAHHMDSELESCKDMVVLLPRKIDKLRSE